jgi:hypothetical protein
MSGFTTEAKIKYYLDSMHNCAEPTEEFINSLKGFPFQDTCDLCKEDVGT